MKYRQTDLYAISTAGFICLVVALALAAFDPGSITAKTREALFDRLLPYASRPPESGRIAVVEIDRAALMTHGNWPWPRDRLAGLVERIAEAKPALLAVEILLPENLDGAGTNSDARLAAALARLPSVLAIVLDPEIASEAPPAAPLAVSGTINLEDLVVMPGAVMPGTALRASAQGLGIVSLPVPEGEPVRRVFLLAGGGSSLLSGFPVETLRVAAGNATMIASGPPQILRIGEASAPVASDGQMRIVFASPEQRERRTIKASTILGTTDPPAMLKDKIVLLGVSAPEAGGLRLTAVDPFLPSVQIQADAIETILGGKVPFRPAWSSFLEPGIALLMGLLGVAAVSMAGIGRAAALAILPPLGWTVGTAAVALATLQLFDPVTPAAVAGLGSIGAAAMRYRRDNLRRAAIERRFALHLSPEVVRRISDNPDELKLKGEERIITALFADIEGFTATTELIGAERMVELLDRYVDTVAGLIISHGGMVDKIVGDGIVAFFNAPVDLPDHPQKALACARAIVEATETLRREQDMKQAGLGRTRIGLETGPAMLGDVGRGAKRSYTAMGRTVNMAARLEAANKELGTAILAGPGFARVSGGLVTLHSRLRLDGINGLTEVYVPVKPQPAS